MSRLEFVAIQFGVKFIVIYILRHYVDRVCQQYLHLPYLFRKLCYFANNFMILFYFILFYFIFEVILRYSLYGLTTLRSHFHSGRIILHSYWLIRTADGRRGRLPYLHPLETLKCLMSVNKHLR